MRIINTSFIQGVVGETAVVYDGTPHVAFIGRSNVGKSSTLNAITGQRKLVKVGQTPGKTKEINFFKAQAVNKENEKYPDLYLVDLPGYGYAKVSKTRRAELKTLIQWYLSHPEADIALICLIIDAKVGLTDIDKEMIQLIQKSGRKYLIAVNKIDKLNQKMRHKLNEDLKADLGKVDVVQYSASTNKHVNLLLNSLVEGAFS